MKRIILAAAAILSTTTFAADAAMAEVTVKLTNMHICCKGCTNGIMKAVEGLDAVKVEVDQDAEETTVTGADVAAVQKAVDAIVAAGYHASVVGDGITIKAADAPAGKVKSLKVSNAHNCCGACNVAIRKALQTVPGVTGDSCKSKAVEFEVTGDFEAKAVVAALEKAGFHVTAK